MRLTASIRLKVTTFTNSRPRAPCGTRASGAVSGLAAKPPCDRSFTAQALHTERGTGLSKDTFHGFPGPLDSHLYPAFVPTLGNPSPRLVSIGRHAACFDAEGRDSVTNS